MQDTDTITKEDFATAYRIVAHREPKAFILLPQDMGVLGQKTYKKLPLKEAGEDVLHSHLLLGDGGRVWLLGLAARMAAKAKRGASVVDDCGCG